MIVKKIKADRSATPSKTKRVTALIDYIDAPENQEGADKCVYTGARHCLCMTRAGQKAEMIALAEEAVASRDPIQHWVLSWREDEQPTVTQVEEAVGLFLGELGMPGHQALYALHADTDHCHLHLVVNRVHPATLKVIKPNRGFDLEAAHRAIARIEQMQGWGRELNGRYRVSLNGEVVRVSCPREPGLGTKARELEARTGEKSAERITLEVGAPILRRATDWTDLHQQLAAQGLWLEQKGRGAVLWIGPVAVKASRVGRECCFSALSQRLGEYRPPASALQIPEEFPESTQRDLINGTTYRIERQEYQRVRKQALAALQRRQQAERQALCDQHCQARGHWLRGSWKGRGLQLNALRRAIATLHAGERMALRDRQRQERAALRQGYPRFSDYVDWQRDRSNAGWVAPVLDPLRPADFSSEHTVALTVGFATEIYHRHFQDIRGQPHSLLDPSRVDAMIAVRMRVTGHSCDEITFALTHGAPSLQDQSEERDWPTYVARAVRYAFGPAGDREVARLAVCRELWRRLEGCLVPRLPREPLPSWNERPVCKMDLSRL